MLLQVTNLSFGFNNRTLLSNLSFQIQTPGFLAIIGHNGAGKSSLVKSFMARLEYLGVILVNGMEVKKMSRLEASGLISCLEQKNILSFDIKVIDLVMMGRFRFKKFFTDYDKEDRKKAMEALEELEITNLADKDFLLLSGGEQQLVWLAQLAVQDTEIVILDEPTQQLDLYNKKRIFDCMNGWVTNKNKQVICVTHDIQNLYGMNGFFINLSEEHPQLRELNDSNLDIHLRILEDRNFSVKGLVSEVL